MWIVIAGSRFLGAAVLERLLADGHEIVGVVSPTNEDRLARAARQAGVPAAVLGGRRTVEAADCPQADLLVAAHCHVRISPAALAAQRFGGIGYHPSLLPRHRGIAAVEWTVRCGDPITGGTVYRLDDGLDTGPILLQRFCHVVPGETAPDLWRRALCPLGVDLLAEVVNEIDSRWQMIRGEDQDARFATEAPASSSARGRS